MVKYNFGCYDPLQYSLLFPNGEVGWHQHIKKTILNDTNENEKTMRDISSFRLVKQIFERECDGNFLKLLFIYFL